MTRTTLRRTTAAAVTLLALASLVACGGDDDGGKNGSSSEAGTGSGSEPGDGTSGEASGDTSEGSDPFDEGDPIEPVDFVDRYLEAMNLATTATLSMNFGGTAAVQGTGSADFSTTPPSMELTITDAGTGQDQRVIIVDGKMYLGLEPKKFIFYDLKDEDNLLGTDLTDQLDPRAMADVFRDGVTRASYLGEEDVDGESLEHYLVLLDSASVIGDADLPSDAPTDGVAEAITIEVWFDDDGLLRRQEATLGPTGDAVELTYDNWGVKVDITAPPKAQIVQLPKS